MREIIWVQNGHYAYPFASTQSAACVYTYGILEQKASITEKFNVSVIMTKTEKQLRSVGDFLAGAGFVQCSCVLDVEEREEEE